MVMFFFNLKLTELNCVYFDRSCVNLRLIWSLIILIVLIRTKVGQTFVKKGLFLV